MPRSFRGEESRFPELSAIPEYKPRSMLEEYRGLTIAFGILGLALAAYFIKSMLAAPKPAPAPPQPQSVYIETVPPAKDQSPR